MNRLLDTNVCIHVLRKKGNALVKARFAASSPTDLALPAVVTAELFHGAELANNPTAAIAEVETFLAPLAVIPFDTTAARHYGRIRADLQRRGLLISPYDMQIAAIALAHGLTLVTHNTGEFSRVVGLSLVDWEIP